MRVGLKLLTGTGYVRADNRRFIGIGGLLCYLVRSFLVLPEINRKDNPRKDCTIAIRLQWLRPLPHAPEALRADGARDHTLRTVTNGYSMEGD